MFASLKEQLLSKKFRMTVIGSAVVAGMAYLHLPLEVILMVGSLFGINIGAQGLADIGKSAAQINPPK